MSAPTDETRALMTLALTRGLGPVLIRRILDRFGTAARAIAAPAGELASLQRVPKGIVAALRDARDRVDEEWTRATDAGVRVLAISHPDYPPLLKSIPDPPPLLYARGSVGPANEPSYPIAIVGSRKASSYGIEQTTRFAGFLASAGLTVVSGGARGIDTAAHRAAIREDGTTVAVLGCGLARCYPPENRTLFDEIVASGGAIVSEFPMLTEPAAENFPRRNRIISGLSLGVIVIEAGDRSGALITARMAVEDHGREVFALPGRVDAPGSSGVHALIRSGGAALVTSPTEVLEDLEAPARFLHAGTHDARYAPPSSMLFSGDEDPSSERGVQPVSAADLDGNDAKPPAETAASTGSAADFDTRLLALLDEPRTADDLTEQLGTDIASVRVRLTLLELGGRIIRSGNRFARR